MLVYLFALLLLALLVLLYRYLPNRRAARFRVLLSHAHPRRSHHLYLLAGDAACGRAQ